MRFVFFVRRPDCASHLGFGCPSFFFFFYFYFFLDKPCWNETFTFGPIPSSDQDYRWLLVEVFDHAIQPKPKDLGYFKVDLFALKINQTVKGWFSLKEAPKGRVMLEISISRAMDKVGIEFLLFCLRRHGSAFCSRCLGLKSGFISFSSNFSF